MSGIATHLERGSLRPPPGSEGAADVDRNCGEAGENAPSALGSLASFSDSGSEGRARRRCRSEGARRERASCGAQPDSPQPSQEGVPSQADTRAGESCVGDAGTTGRAWKGVDIRTDAYTHTHTCTHTQTLTHTHTHTYTYTYTR
eukprot:GHVU01220001.1.p1 GENE.GHVU01220001.1~~GHVU01220001.1.p1  ORF type:complete len:145 (-),score=8.21 GHVU01220001.1:16-450(-)